MHTSTSFGIKKMSVQLVVTDINRSIAFYDEVLGFDVDFRHADFYAGVVRSGWSIHLKLGSPSDEVRKNKRTKEHLDIIFSVDGIEDIYRELSDKNVEFVQPLREMPYGKEFYIADPDGYIIGFNSPK
jgi:catechol 2,3-dioxygenase-like lactoylglutathione lyase family enzyme